MNEKKSFVSNRLKSLQCATQGCFYLLKTETNIKIQMVIAIAMTIFGFVFQISVTEWLFQILAICVVICAESFNTAVEKLADFMHPSYHKEIGIIKDLSAGAVLIASFMAVIIGGIIYIPKLF